MEKRNYNHSSGLIKTPGHRALRHGRVSLENSRYFLTMVTHERKVSLTPCFPELLHIAKSIETETQWQVIGLVVMPDHLHILIRLLDINLSKCVRLFKGRSASSLRTQNIFWQKNAYFDHRLRPFETDSSFLRYMLLNPYLQNLLGWDEIWPAWWLSEEASIWFSPTTNEGRPFREWAKNGVPFSLPM